MPTFSPPLDALPHLRTPLSPGEARVLEFLKRHLGAIEEEVNWEVYIQPHLNGLRPDFVLLHPYMGVAVVEVKEWSIGAQGLQLVRRANRLALVGHHDGVAFRVSNPLARLSEYVMEVSSQYARVSNWREAKEMVSGTLVVFGPSHKDATSLFMPLLGQETDWTPRLNLVTGELIEEATLEEVVPLSSGTIQRGLLLGPSGMGPEVAARLRPFLQEPDVAAQQREPLSLNTEQREMTESRTVTGYRRVRGPAGSGKTTVLAARTAELSAAGNQVLFVCFNQTLWHYVRDLVVRHATPDGSRADLNRITFTHYHRWAKWICFDAGLEPEYRAIWSGASGFPDGPLSRLVEMALQDAMPTYDALLVDEAQDFLPEWWRQLRQVVRSPGEYLLAADRAQDIYERNQKWTGVAMTGAGFTGPWSELHGCHRLPDNLIPMLRRYAEAFRLGDERSLPEVSTQPELPIGSCSVRWDDAPPQQFRETLVDAVSRMADAAEIVLPWADVCVLVQEDHVGLELVQDLRRLYGLRAVHVFGGDADRGRMKRAFWLGDARIKVSTIHSFKGWESRAIVLGLSVRDWATAYVGLTRIKRHDVGSYLTVVTTQDVGRVLRPYFDGLNS